MNELILRRYIKEALVLDAGAAGTASLDIPGGIKDINIMDIVSEEMTKGDPTGKKMQQILAFNEMVYDVAFQGGSSNAWQAIAEKMMTQWDFEVPPQGAGGEEVSTFYDVIKGNVYYSVKAAFKTGVNPMNPAAGPSSSPIKIEAICALIIKRPDITMLGNIGCACNLGKPDNPLIGWGEVTAPISRDAVIENIKNLIVDKNEELANKFINATANKPSNSEADAIINEINGFFVKELGRKKGRLDQEYIWKILGSKTNTMIGTLKLVPPEELFDRTLGSGVKAGVRSDGTEVGSKEQRADFMRRMRSVARTLSSVEMEDVITTAIRMLTSAKPDTPLEETLKQFTPPTQAYLREHFKINESRLLKKYIRSLLECGEEPGQTLQPLMDPLFNLREIVKELTLLEDHMNNPSKQCPDCINKHLMKCEALSEEAVSLDGDNQYPFISSVPQVIRGWHKAVLDNDVIPPAVPAEMRRFRKMIMPHVANKFEV